MNNKGIVRMEKRAANKGGIFLVILIALIGLGVGGYFLYQNKDEINWPWEKEEEVVEEKEEEEDNTSDGKLHLPEISPEIDLIQLRYEPAKMHITKLTATAKGYELDIELVIQPDENGKYDKAPNKYVVNCTKILIDDYEVSSTFTVEATKSQLKSKTSVIIPMNELENLEIYSFRALTFFLDVQATYDFPEKIKKAESRVTAYQDIFVNNVKEPEASFTAQDSVRISYYKKIEAEDATYLYYIVENNNRTTSHKIELKKLVINDEIYNKPVVNVDTHYHSNTIFYIKIPRKDYKEVTKITAAFYILRPEGEDQAIFMTNDLTVDYAKEETK